MRVLVIEDEFLVASAVAMLLETHGHAVLGPAATAEAAFTLLEQSDEPDAAILDLNLRGERSDPVAEELERRNIPFVFATGYEIDGALHDRFPRAPWLRKPYTDKTVLDSLSKLASPTRAGPPAQSEPLREAPEQRG